jgi:hypothetical protein
VEQGEPLRIVVQRQSIRTLQQLDEERVGRRLRRKACRVDSRARRREGEERCGKPPDPAQLST